MKKRFSFSIFRNAVYFGCMVFAYGIAGSLELGRLTLSEAIYYLFAALCVCFGVNVLRFCFLLPRALRIRRKKIYGTHLSSTRSVPFAPYRT